MYRLPEEEFTIALNKIFKDALDFVVGDPESDPCDLDNLMDFVPSWCSKERALESYKELKETLYAKEDIVPDLLCEYINATVMDSYIDFCDENDFPLRMEVSEEYKKVLYDTIVEDSEGFYTEETDPKEVLNEMLDIHEWKNHLWDIDYALLDLIPETQLRGSELDAKMGIY